MSLRLTLFCHAATAATRRAAFPTDEPLEPSGAVKSAELASSLGRVDIAWTSPALRARQTAKAMQLDALVDARLRDLDVGHWAGQSMTEVQAVDPDGLAAWIGDPRAAPHGGESIAALLERTAAWLAAINRDAGRAVAVTHASLIRAAVVVILGAKPEAFWRVDVGPLCRVNLQGNGGVWTLRSIGAAGPDRI